jgi:hypothetical protein
MKREKQRRWRLRTLAVAGVVAFACPVLFVVPACNGDCEVKTCDMFGGSVSVTFTKCYAGVSPIETTLEDPNGNQFFDCTDPPGGTCTEATVTAESNYCYTHQGSSGTTTGGGNGAGASNSGGPGPSATVTTGGTGVDGG